METERLEILDISKLIGLVLVTAGHLSNGPVRNYIYLFHIPFFFVASGMVLRDRKSSLSEIIAENRKLLIVYYVLNLAIYGYVLISGPENYQVIPGVNDLLLRVILLEGFGTLWFIGTLVIGRVLFRIIRKVNRQSHQIALLAVLYAASMVIGRVLDAGKLIYRVENLPLILLITILKGVIACVFLSTGFYLKAYWMKLIRWLQGNTVSSALTAAVCFGSLIPFCSFTQMDIHLLQFGMPVLNVILGLIGTVMILAVASLLEKTPASKPLAYLGRNSLILMSVESLQLLLVTYTFLCTCFNHQGIFVKILSLVLYIAELFLITVFPGKAINRLIQAIDSNCRKNPQA